MLSSVFQCLRAIGSFPTCCIQFKKNNNLVSLARSTYYNKVALGFKLDELVCCTYSMANTQQRKCLPVPPSEDWKFTARRLTIAYKFMSLSLKKLSWSRFYLFTDDETFTTNANSNLQVYHYWSLLNPHVTIEKSF